VIRTIGFAAQTTDSEFSRDVSQSVHRVADREHIRLIAVNHYSPNTALRNAAMCPHETAQLFADFFRTHNDRIYWLSNMYRHIQPLVVVSDAGISLFPATQD
jgi:hypothetical protein